MLTRIFSLHLPIRIFSAAVFLFVVTSAQADNSNAISTALNKCAEIKDADARLTCFDALAEMNPRAPILANSDAPPSAAAKPTPVPLPADIGKEAMAGTSDDKKIEYSAVVTRCEENAQSGQYYFYLENGQVWKQSNYQRLRYRNCAFDVTLSKGTFGYRLYIPSKDRSIRVTRIR